MCKGLYPQNASPTTKVNHLEGAPQSVTSCHVYRWLYHMEHTPETSADPTGSTSVPARLERTLQTGTSLVRWWIPESARERRRCLEDRTVENCIDDLSMRRRPRQLFWKSSTKCTSCDQGLGGGVVRSHSATIVTKNVVWGLFKCKTVSLPETWHNTLQNLRCRD